MNWKGVPCSVVGDKLYGLCRFNPPMSAANRTGAGALERKGRTLRADLVLRSRPDNAGGLLAPQSEVKANVGLGHAFSLSKTHREKWSNSPWSS
jgi:hypothetical protein